MLPATIRTQRRPVEYNSSDLLEYHRAWGHLNFKECLQQLNMSSGSVGELVCAECKLCKSRRKPCPEEAVRRSDQPLHSLHMDLSGRKLASLEGYRYYLMVCDDHTRYRWVRFVVTKDQCTEEFISLAKQLEREFSPNRIAIVRTDGGGEFVNHAMEKFFRENGIKPEKSSPHSQFQNGVAERSMHLFDKAKAIMMFAGSPSYDWPHALSYVVHISNRCPSRGIGGAKPIELLTGNRYIPPRKMPIFGCLGYAKEYIVSRTSMEPKAKRVVFLGYSDAHKADLVRDISSFSNSLRMFPSRDADYDNRIFPYKSRMVPRPPIPPRDQEDVKDELRRLEAQQKADESSEVQVVEAEVREDGSPVWEVKSIVGKRKSRFGPRGGTKGFDYRVVWGPEGMWPDSWEPEANLVDCMDLVQEYNASNASSDDDEKVDNAEVPRRSARLSQEVFSCVEVPDPTYRSEALSSPDRQQWIEAEQEELASLAEHGVWELVPREPGMNVLGCKFVYTKKRKPNGEVYRRKVRLVAKGFKQKEGIDFSATFSTTVAMQAVRFTLWLSVVYRLFLWKVDIKTFFLYGELKENIFMDQPPGYRQGNKVCRLLKTIYGLKQSARYANEKLVTCLKRMGVRQLKTDPLVFFWRSGNEVLILCVWIDDILVQASSQKVFDWFSSAIKATFEITFEKDPSYFLQIEIVRDREKGWMKLHQTGYATRLLQKFRMAECTSLKVPFVVFDANEICMDKSLPYLELVGSLLWLLKTRPDLSIYMSILARYMCNYDKRIFQYALRVLRYLKGTLGEGIVYQEDQDVPIQYGKGVKLSFQVDANWGSTELGSKSTTGWLVRANNSTVFSGSQIQRRVATNTVESETNALEFVCKEVEWYRDFLSELEIEVEGPSPVFEDNAGAVALSQDPVMRPRTKYFRIVQDYIRHCVLHYKVIVVKIPGSELAADILSKPVPYPLLTRHKKLLMGDQNLLPVTLVGKEFSSDITGDGPRCKQVSRRDPGIVRRRLQQQKAQSQSSHRPPMIARCMRCDLYLEWKETMSDWKSCPCDNGPVFVTCIMCGGGAEYVRNLNYWFCPSCTEDMVYCIPPPRKRKHPDRYS